MKKRFVHLFGLLSMLGLIAGAVTAAPAAAWSPDCTQATASPNIVWPPNHKLRLITVAVPDADNDQTVTITGVTQDEPLMTTGSGHTTPDAQSAPQSGHTGRVYVRAERKGDGDGRVYRISFTAEDASHVPCSGTVTVGVRHDMGRGRVPIDSGQLYNSFGI